MIFPAICPVCRADSGRRVIPTSPEVDTFRCGDCQAEWSEPASADRYSVDQAVEDSRWIGALAALQPIGDA